MTSLYQTFRRMPFLRLLMPLITGIIAGLKFFEAVSLPAGWVLSPGLFFLLGIFVLSGLSLTRANWLFGLFLFLFLTWFGGVLVYMQHQQQFSFRGMEEKHYFLTVPLREPEEKTSTYALSLKILKWQEGDTWHAARQVKIMVYFGKDSLSRTIEPGVPLLVQGTIRKFPEPLNPGEFNYGRYMRDRGYCGRIFLSSGDWTRAEWPLVYSPVIFASRLRSRLSGILQNYIPEKNVLSVVQALVLGEREKIDEEVRNSFVDAGVVHVMAISGLHVGIIYFVIMYFLSFLGTRPHGTVIRSLLVILLLWMYAFLTGLTPSVMRAATMFSLLAVGKALKRRPDVFNILALSAFILLCLNPVQIRSIGFQLSYLAVASILLFYPKIYGWLTFRLWITDRLWSLVSLSLSAQIGVLPLVLFYFHQFPVYFLPANLAAIPLVTVVIYTGFLILILSFAGFIPHLLGGVLVFVVKILLNSVEAISSLPHSVIHNVFISPAGLLFLYLSLLMLGLFLYNRLGKWLLVSLAMLVAFSVWEWSQVIKHQNQKVFEVFNVNGPTALQFVKGNSACIYLTPDTFQNRNQVNYASKGNLANLRVNKTGWLDEEFPTGQVLDHSLHINHQYFQFLTKRGLFIKNLNHFKNAPSEPIPVHWLIITGTNWVNPDELMKFVDPDIIIAGPTVPYYYSEKYERIFHTLHQPFHNVKAKGTYIEVL